MGMKIGGIDIMNSIVNLEMQIKLHQKIIEWIYINHKDFKMPAPEILSAFKEDILNELKKQYPDLGINVKRTLYVKCKNCGQRFTSPIQCAEASFKTCDLKQNSYQCPLCKKSYPYDKENHYFAY